MQGYDPNQHSFPPTLVLKMPGSQELPKTPDTCATEPEPPSNSTSSPQGLSTDVLKPSLLQVGGKHYKEMAIQPVEYCYANRIPFIEGSVIKYISRWREKGGVQDLKKAKHFIDLLIELEEKNEH